MHKLKHLSVDKQVLFVFGTLCAILLIIGGLYFFSLRAIERGNQRQMLALKISAEINDAAQDLERMQAGVLRQLLAADFGETRLLDRTVRDIEKENANDLADHQNFVDTEKERQLYDAVMQARKAYWEQTQPVLALGLINRNAEATKLIITKQSPAYDACLKAINELANYVETSSDEMAAETTRFISKLRIIGNALAGLAICIVIGAGFTVAGIARRLKGDNRILQIEVTDRKQAENALRESNEKFQQLAENITDVFWVRSPDMREVQYVSPAFERVWGRPVKSLYENPQQWADFIFQEDRERVLGAFAALTRDAANLDIEYRIVRPDGEIRWVRARGYQVRDASNKLIRNTGIVSDITGRKLSEAALEKAHHELVAASRRAGMAEVATGVLHNVGNVLNSINVASACVADNLRKSKAASLSRVVALLREHETDLGAYLGSDPKGKQIPAYLARLGEQLVAEQAAALGELADLQKNIEHIKEVVTVQQSGAKAAGKSETLQVTDLVEDTLRMFSGGQARGNLQVVREFEAAPAITVEKHKVLQILMNLVRNAKQACDEGGCLEKRLTIRVTNGDDRVRIAVSDNGVGIPPESLPRIFAHGFTTKMDGHGFGLHSAAIAAKEMGGSLNVHSAGAGLGATFTLEVPCKPLDEEPSDAKRRALS